MQRQLNDAYNTLNIQLTDIGATLEESLKDRQAALIGSAGDQKGDMDKLVLQARLQLQQTRRLAEQKGALYKAQLLDGFRQEVLDAAKQIADSRGAVAVVAASSDLLWYSSTIDITDETIDLLRVQ